MKYTCTKACYYRSRLWAPGETLESSSGEEVPCHFVPAGKIKSKKAKEYKEPETYYELQRKQAKDILDAKKITEEDFLN